MNIKCTLQRVVAVILLFARKDRELLQFQSISLLREFILNLLEMLFRRRNNDGIGRLLKAQL